MSGLKAIFRIAALSVSIVVTPSFSQDSSPFDNGSKRLEPSQGIMEYLFYQQRACSGLAVAMAIINSDDSEAERLQQLREQAWWIPEVKVKAMLHSTAAQKKVVYDYMNKACP